MNFRHPVHSRKLNFVLFPCLFFIGGYLIVVLMAFPFLGMMSSYSKLLFFDTEIKGGTLGNIFTSAPANQQKNVELSAIEYPQYGTCFGQISIPSASITAKLYFGDGSEELKEGAGLYNGSFIPGYGKTILIAGHNHTFFHTLGQAKINDQITIATNYGTYRYRVTETKVKAAADKTAYDLNSSKENLILYTCYPFDCIGLTPQRYYVYAEYVSGPIIDKQG